MTSFLNRKIPFGTPPAGRGGRRRLARRVLLAAGVSLTALVLPIAGVAGALPTKPADRAAAAVPAPTPSPAAPQLGPDVYIFSPTMPESQIQATVDAIADQQIPNQFGTQRYALLFEPGTYGSVANPLSFQVGYYTEVAGLGQQPGDVVINGTIDVYNQCSPVTGGATSCVALDNFWRSLSNLTIDVTGQTGCQSATDFWAVSQAAPMRRVDITGGNLSLMDYCNGSPDYASGGFIADSAFSGGTVINGSQQQFIVRNSDLDGWSNGVWNQVFSGDVGAPAQSFSANSGLGGGSNPYTTLTTSPVTEEEPFLQTDAAGKYSVFVPAAERDSSGTSWSSGTTAGTTIPIKRFFVATPTSSVETIDLALAAGRDLILTPGVYHLDYPIIVSRPDTVILGMGFATLVPDYATAAMDVLNVPGLKLSGVIFDAGPVRSPVLLQVGYPYGACDCNATDPTVIQDVFFRIGGATAGAATTSMVVDNSDTILDNIWAWRADHGAGVGWNDNIGDTGLVVNGNDVTAYGLAVEHYQKTEVVWNGQGGTDIFFQNEMPYDPPDQAAWMQNATTDGYPSFQVSPSVTSFQGYGMGSYSNFDLGVPIESSTAFTVPDKPGVQLNDIFTRYLNNSGGIGSVVNGTGTAVDATFPGPSDIVTYP